MTPGVLTLIVLSLVNGIMVLVSYLSAGNLPDPLSLEEEKELLERLCQGDKLARIILVERNLRLVAKIANKIHDHSVEKQDLFQNGVVGLIKAVDTFDSTRANKFSTYAGVCIQNEMLMVLRKHKNDKKCVSMSEPLDCDKDGTPLELKDTLMTDELPVEEQVANNLDVERLEKAIQKLAPREQRVITLRFGLTGQEEMTQKEVGKQLNISRSFISRIESNSIHKLSKELSNM
ncbi:RNA polymerase sporulation sigma factor SigK [Desulforamulus ruminis]|uniref:RNA polymerase sigma factor n=1 Tax=Desulforamulus ruminis (strain ATCC 23193 / DSM 2154 / NCIMB 8452 / DL) TaxID=696281 RepID=F6DKG9_DESRL|nr:RNA polymerase sporulation sigma factor SigK [Desulforamulus ruminis]AEG59229.1 RNA polymerase sigma factor, sigma-70 family [Desulforamulus ruminis DSM 2154]